MHLGFYYSQCQDWHHPGGEAMHGVKWMQLLADHFDRSVWLNPDPPTYWRGGTAEALSTVFRMFQLTLEGLGEAVRHLSGAQRSRA